MIPRTAREKGTTVIELASSLFGLIVLTGGIASLMGTGMTVWKGSTLETSAETDVNRTLERIVTHLSWAGRDSVLAGFAESPVVETLEYRPVIDCTDGKVTWGNLMRIEWAPDPGDPEDGLDNNGNGVIDEGVVRLVRNSGIAGETSSVLARGVMPYFEGESPNGQDDNGNGLVDERGLCFERRGGAVAVRLSLCRKSDDGESVVRTAETSVTPRN
jgi:hypothetical protein